MCYFRTFGQNNSDVAIRLSDPDFPKENNNLAIRQPFQLFIIEQVRYLLISTSSLFDLTLNTCHMLRSVLGVIFTKLNSVNLSVR